MPSHFTGRVHAYSIIPPQRKRTWYCIRPHGGRRFKEEEEEEEGKKNDNTFYGERQHRPPWQRVSKIGEKNKVAKKKKVTKVKMKEVSLTFVREKGKLLKWKIQELKNTN